MCCASANASQNKYKGCRTVRGKSCAMQSILLHKTPRGVLSVMHQGGAFSEKFQVSPTLTLASSFGPDTLSHSSTPSAVQAAGLRSVPPRGLSVLVVACV